MYYVDGEWIQPGQPAIQPEDRGYQFGDGIYEVVRVYQGKLYQWDEHLIRLERSAKELDLVLPVSNTELEQIAKDVLCKNNLEFSDATVYLQISRGVHARQFPFPEGSRAVLTMYANQKDRPFASMKEGISAALIEDIRWLRCDIKSLNLLGASIAKQKSIEAGSEEAIMHRGDIVTEASSANIFTIKDGVLYTHPATNLILHGITRKTILQLCANLNLTVKEETYTTDFLASADEIFICGTTSEITPIVKVNNQAVGTGIPGPVTRSLQEAFEVYILSQTKTAAI
ncbi:D-amino-acid transaminase [Brevibacillus daliensis]|uniref:D-amino-acid transaminase n=1 Tax=Brevibacillus daliensis TaxID=2892995 RepID=UPI001E46CBFB|nr:D-amino-acid transaminase [Brevibacillus daliensis]